MIDYEKYKKQISQTMECDQHNKQLEFFCQIHQLFCCSKCISRHIDCQVQNQFNSLEDMHEKFNADASSTLGEMELFIEQKIGEKVKQENDFTQLQFLKSEDIEAIQSFFKIMREKCNLLEKQILENYYKNFIEIEQKIKSKEKSIDNYLTLLSEQKTEIQKLKAEVNSIQSTDQKFFQAVFSHQKLNEIKEVISKPLNDTDLSYNLEQILSKEQIFSELGHLNQLAENLEIKAASFTIQNFQQMIKQTHLLYGPDQLAQQNVLQFKTPENEDKLEEQKRQEELDQVIGIDTQIVNEEDICYKYVQLRYCSNEVYVFDEKKQKFATYQLFTSKNLKVPFMIFNNCCQALIKNHIIFLFGGLDPSQNEKTSDRTFCFNLNKASELNKVVVYEIDEMVSPRSEFTLSTVNNFIYIISGYNQWLSKDKRVISKCERFDLKSKKFYEIRDVNYPRLWATSVNINNQFIYLFNGYNAQYLNIYVDKIEKYTVNLNDWQVLKFHVSETVIFNPTMKAAGFQVSQNEIIILGGNRDGCSFKGFYLFDMKQLVLTKDEKEILPSNDEFLNQNNLFMSKFDDLGYFFSSNFVKRIYCLKYNNQEMKAKISFLDEELVK